jgi:hypothetical protein
MDLDNIRRRKAERARRKRLKKRKNMCFNPNIA